MDESICDEVRDKFWWQNMTCKTQSFYILLTFLLITITLVISDKIFLLADKILSKTKTFITISQHKLKSILIMYIENV